MQSTSYEQFFCPYCQSWLYEDGCDHEAGHHNDNEEIDERWPTRYRLLTVITETGEEIITPGDEQERAERKEAENGGGGLTMTTGFIHFHANRIAWKVEGKMPNDGEVEPLPQSFKSGYRFLSMDESRDIALAVVINKMVSQYKPDTIRLTYHTEDNNE